MSTPPLRKVHQESGLAYTRFPDVEDQIGELYGLSDTELIERCRLPRSAPNFVHTQTVVHFTRQRLHDHAVFAQLFDVLSMRARQVRYVTLDPNFEEHTLESAFDKFVMLLASETTGYNERLDFFEVDFAGAYSKVLLDEQRRHIAQRVPFVDVAEDNQPDEELSDDSEFNDAMVDALDFRLRWQTAWERMTLRQRLVLKMRRYGIPVETNDPEGTSISKLLGNTPKTIRSDLKKAYDLFKKLSEEGAKV